MAKRLIVANWKAYIETPEQAVALAKAVRKKAAGRAGTDVVVAPPYVFLPHVQAALKGSRVRAAAQTVSVFEGEKHTGEVTAAMLAALRVAAVIIGHSERRAAGETDATVQQQVRRADRAKLRIILCVGELERDLAGTHFETIAGQLRAALGESKPAAAKLVVAYEPVWAIGKSAADAMKPSDVQETVIFIRKVLADLFGRTAALRIPVLYGGSVEAENARALIAEGGASGFLIGHASVDADSFAEIVKAAQ